MDLKHMSTQELYTALDAVMDEIHRRRPPARAAFDDAMLEQFAREVEADYKRLCGLSEDEYERRYGKS
jgi:hypothetical protein